MCLFLKLCLSLPFCSECLLLDIFQGVQGFQGIIGGVTHNLSLNGSNKYILNGGSDETPELPIFDQIQIVTSVDEKERLEKVEAYEKEHNVQIL